MLKGLLLTAALIFGATAALADTGGQGSFYPTAALSPAVLAKISGSAQVGTASVPGSDISHMQVTVGGVQYSVPSALGLMVPSAGGDTSATVSTATGATVSRKQADRQADMLSVMDYGAKCDGLTPDTAAINAAYAALRSVSNAGMPAGLSYPSRRRCLITGSINATEFRGPSTVIEGHGTQLLCAASGGICYDMTGSGHMRTSDFGVVGSSTAVPKIGIQIARQDNNTDSTENKTTNFVTSGYFSLAPVYVESAEDTSWYDTHIQNDNPAAGTFVVIEDGNNHWNATSAFQNITIPVDSSPSFNENVWMNPVFVQRGTGSVLWEANTHRHQFLGGAYSLDTGTAPAVVLFDEGLGSNWNLVFDMHFEFSPKNIFLVSGSNPTPTIEGLDYFDHYGQATSSIFGHDAGISTVNLLDLRLRVENFLTAGATVFDDPTRYTMSGLAYVPAVVNWNLPVANTQGMVNIGGAVSVFGSLPVPLTAQASALAPLNGIGTITTTVAALWSIPSGGTNFPQVLIGAPQAVGGNQATASFSQLLLNSSCGTLLSGGTGFTVGDVISPATGTPSAAGGLKCKVTSISGGGSTGPIASLSTVQYGYYSSLPVDTTSVPMTGGTGTGATFHGLQWIMPAGSANFISTTVSGSGYTAPPSISFPATPGVTLTAGSPGAAAALVPGVLSVSTNGGPITAGNFTMTAVGGKVNLDPAGTLWVQESSGKAVIGTGSTNLFSIDPSGNVLAKGTISGSSSP